MESSGAAFTLEFLSPGDKELAFGHCHQLDTSCRTPQVEEINFWGSWHFWSRAVLQKRGGGQREHLSLDTQQQLEYGSTALINRI